VAVVRETVFPILLLKYAIGRNALTIPIDLEVAGTKIILGILLGNVEHNTGQNSRDVLRGGARGDAEIDVDFHTTIELTYDFLRRIAGEPPAFTKGYDFLRKTINIAGGIKTMLKRNTQKLRKTRVEIKTKAKLITDLESISKVF